MSDTLIKGFFKKVKNYFNGIRCPSCNSYDCKKRSQFILGGDNLFSSKRNKLLENTFVCFKCNSKFIVNYKCEKGI